MFKKFLLPAFCCALLASCGGSKTDSAASGSAATAASDTIAAVPQEQEEVKLPDFKSDDLRALGLRDQVKKLEITGQMPEGFLTAECFELTFAQKGKASGLCYDDYTAKRNADGIDVDLKMQYGTDGTCAKMKYKDLNPSGHPLKAEYYFFGPGYDEIDADFTFSDYVYDEHQNWTSRKVKAVYKLTDFETGAVSNKTDSWTDTRTISYY